MKAFFLAEEFIFNRSNQVYDIIIVHFTGELSSASAELGSADTVGAGVLLGWLVIEEARQDEREGLLIVPGEMVAGGRLLA